MIKSYKYSVIFLLLSALNVGAGNFVPASFIMGHVKLLQEFKSRLLTCINNIKPSAPRGAITPTIAHAKAFKSAKTCDGYGVISSELKKDYRQMKKKYKTIVDEALQQESELRESHYVFYHGQKISFRVWQDVLKRIYSFINIHQPLKDFEFIRAWYHGEKLPTVNDFIDREEAQNGYLGSEPSAIYWNDSLPHLTRNMLCVNLSLFGNFSSSGESSFWYFVNNTNVASPGLQNLLEGVWNHFGFDKKYIARIVKLEDSITTPEGNLLQIFIPKEKVDKYVYLSKPFGTPVREPLIHSVFNEQKARHMKISPILEKYAENPASMNDFDLMQARILLSQDCIMNPQSGVKIYKYTTAPKNLVAQYQKELDEIVVHMLQEWIESPDFSAFKSSTLSQLIKYMHSK